MKPKKSLSSS